MGVSYPILSNVFRGTPSDNQITQILSGPQNFKNTVTSWPYDQSMPSKPYFINGRIKHVTSNNFERFETTPYDFFKNGDFSPTIDDVNKYNPGSFEKWRFAGEGRHSSSFISVPYHPSDSVVLVGFAEQLWKTPQGQTPLHNKYVTPIYFENLRYNDFGKALHHAGNLKQDVMDYLTTYEGRALASHLLKLGLNPEDIGYVGYADLPERVVYMVTRAEDGKIVLLVSKGANDVINEVATAIGVRPKRLRYSSLAEELAHIWARHVDDPRGLFEKEIEAKLWVAENYGNLEEDYGSGNPNNARYVRERSIAKTLRLLMEEEARRVPETYREFISSSYKQLYSRNKGLLKEKLTEDARNKGLRGGAIDEYVEGRLAQIEAEVEGNSKLSNLESIVKDDRASERSERPQANAEPVEASASSE